MFQHIKKFDWILIFSVLLLTGIGLVSIYSISLLYFKKQVIFMIIGLFLMVLLSFFDWRAFRENSYFILVLYFLCILALFGLFFLAPEIRGVKSWYKLGSVSFNPTSISAIILTILLAKYFSMRHVEMYKLPHILLSGFYVLLPFILIAKQPDLGSALILLVLWLGILIISGIKLKHFLILMFCGCLILVLSWSFLLKDYQKARITSFLAPHIEPLGMSWSQTQSKIAIGSGGIFGKGIGQGSQTQYGFLPESHTDFIFAVIAEEFGLIGVVFVFCLFTVLIWQIMKIAISAQSNFPRLFASGFAIVLFSQIFIHIGMNLGLLPVIGISLPLISYGGSSLIAIYIGLGIIQSIKTH